MAGHRDGLIWTQRLHTRLLGPLGAAMLQLQVCERAEVSGLPTSVEEVQRLRRMLLEVEATARAMLEDPGEVAEQGLGPRVRRSVQRYRHLHPGIAIHLQTAGLDRPVPRSTAEAALGILEESLANAARHGRPTRIEVDLTVGTSSLLLRVRDDGCGFDARAVEADRPPHRYGLYSMRRLAESVGGNLVVSSVPGRGAQVTFFAAAGP